MRPSFPLLYMEIAHTVAKRSHHPTTKVGTVITSFDNMEILAIGYNGVESKGKNSVDSIIPGKSGTIHSEQNAAISCKAPRMQLKTVYITHSPCLQCSRILINLGGVKRCYYNKEYRNKEGLALLKKHKILVKKI